MIKRAYIMSRLQCRRRGVVPSRVFKHDVVFIYVLVLCNRYVAAFASGPVRPDVRSIRVRYSYSAPSDVRGGGPPRDSTRTQ